MANPAGTKFPTWGTVSSSSSLELGAGRYIKTSAVDSVENKLSGFRRLPTLN